MTGTVQKILIWSILAVFCVGIISAFWYYFQLHATAPVSDISAYTLPSLKDERVAMGVSVSVSVQFADVDTITALEFNSLNRACVNCADEHAVFAQWRAALPQNVSYQFVPALFLSGDDFSDDVPAFCVHANDPESFDEYVDVIYTKPQVSAVDVLAEYYHDAIPDSVSSCMTHAGKDPTAFQAALTASYGPVFASPPALVVLVPESMQAGDTTAADALFAQGIELLQPSSLTQGNL